MESSHVSEDAEECHSSESGWTMYIGSPIHSYDDDEDDDDDDGDDYDNHSVKPGDDSDDSMASDASSGRSHHRDHSWGNGKGVEDDGKQYCPQKKVQHDPAEKKGFETKKKEKGGSVFTAKRANVAAQISQSCEREKKNSWFGKRK